MGDVTFEQVQALIDQYGKYVNGSLDRIEKANLRDHEEIKAMVQRNHDEMKACLQSSEAENTEWFNDHEGRLHDLEQTKTFKQKLWTLTKIVGATLAGIIASTGTVMGILVACGVFH